MITRRPKKKRPSRRRYRTDAPRTWLLLASGRDGVVDHAEEIRELASAGHVVRLGYRGGRLPSGMPRGRHRLGTFRLGPVRTATAALTAPLPLERKLGLAARHDRWLREVAPVADVVVFLDDAAAQHLGDRVRELAPTAEICPPDRAARLLAEEAAWRALAVGARELDGRLPGGRITLSRVLAPAERLVELGGPGPLREDLARDVRPELRRLSRWALRRGRLDKVDALLAVVDLLDTIFPPAPREADAVAALRAHVALVRDEPVGDVVALAGAVLTHADAALEEDALKEASELGAIALGLLFHQQLHTARERTPLVEDPDTFLAPLRASRVGQLLAAPGPRPLGADSLLEEVEGEDAAGVDLDEGRVAAAAVRPSLPGSDDGTTGAVTADGTTDDAEHATRPQRVSMLPGIYANHAAPLLAALEEDERTRLTTVAPTTVTFRGMMIDAPLVQYRLEHALGRTPTGGLGVTREDFDAVTGADVVVADWADKGAVWASTVVPDGTRMVVRLHSVDVLSAPAQLVDWSRVDDIVFVAEHVRDAFTAIMGPRVAHARTHVVTNIVPPERFPDPLLPDASRTLGIVGWGQVVKDPTFALEILERLVQEDDRWRLRLIGTDFGQHHAAAANDYARRFRERAMEADLVDRIDYTGFTRELPRHLRHVGFVLSTSLREGCPVGTLEGTAAGAFPVVRDWPAFARYDGARRLFPERCVVTTPDEAASLISSLADEEDRRHATEQVRADMSAHFSDDTTKDRLLAIILGVS